MPTAHPPATARQTIRLLVGAALACLLVGLVAGALLWHEARWEPTVGDLTLGSGSPPPADLAHVTGFLRTEDVLRIRHRGRNAEWIVGYVPFVPPGWRRGDPAAVLLHLPRREAPPPLITRLGPGGAFTTRPAFLRTAAPWDALIRAADREEVTLASPVLIVEEYVFNAYDNRFFFVLLGAGLCLGLLAIAAFVGWRSRRGQGRATAPPTPASAVAARTRRRGPRRPPPSG